MPEVTKKPLTDIEKVTLTLRVHKQNAAKIRAYARAVEAEEERTYGVDEVFPELIGRKSMWPCAPIEPVKGSRSSNWHE